MTTDTIAGIDRNETMVPLLPCLSFEDTLEFYEALGFVTTYKMTKPYLYLAFRWSGVELHFGRGSARLVPKDEMSGGCLVAVNEVEPYHRAFASALRAKYGKVLAAGLPRITRFRPGQSRFSLIDPSGNSIIFIQRDEPEELNYGGSGELSGLAKTIDNARILRDFKTDDRAAGIALDTGLKRYRETAPKVDLVRALAARAEIAVAMGDGNRVSTIRGELKKISLSPEEREMLSEELIAGERLTQWLAASGHDSEPE